MHAFSGRGNHLVDHAMGLSTSCFVTSKEPAVIINGTIRSWTQI